MNGLEGGGEEIWRRREPALGSQISRSLNVDGLWFHTFPELSMHLPP